MPTLHRECYRSDNRAVASGPAGPTLVGPLFGSKMRGVLMIRTRAHTR